MVSSKIQLVAIGKQDKVLTGNPQISFFKSVYKRHTNFFKYKRKVTFDTAPDFGGKTNVQLPRYGDLLYDMALVFDLPQLSNNSGENNKISYTNAIGHTIIKNISLKIGGRVIDSYSGEWLHISKELNTKISDKNRYDYMIGQTLQGKYSSVHRVFHTPSHNDDDELTISTPVKYNNKKHWVYQNYGGNSGDEGHIIITPLKFWFCKVKHKALPIISLRFYNIDIELELRPFSECYSYYDSSNTPDVKTITECYLINEYIFLDEYERKRFIFKEHDYLITQIQMNEFTIPSSTTNDMIDLELRFHNPVIELIWVCQLKSWGNDVFNYNQWINFSNNTLGIIDQINDYKPITNAQILFNGEKRTDNLDELVYRKFNIMNLYSGDPESFIYVYPFSLEPENMKQPTGTANFSRLENAHLRLTFNRKELLRTTESTIRVYARSYNILKIKDGMGGTLYEY